MKNLLHLINILFLIDDHFLRILYNLFYIIYKINFAKLISRDLVESEVNNNI